MIASNHVHDQLNGHPEINPENNNNSDLVLIFE